jgi:class 3 adenylate cyclase
MTTVMFADICRSTFLFSQLGDEVAARLVYNALESAASIVGANGGKVLRTRGDDVLCIFADTHDALETALAIHRSTRNQPQTPERTLEMRVGVHTGPVLLSDRDITGDTVNTAARLCNIAKGGQTIVSRRAVDGLKTESPGLFRQLGEMSLKGISGPVSPCELLDRELEDEITMVGLSPPASTTSNRLSISFQSVRHEFDFRLVRFLLGRSSDCDLEVPHPLVSRHHAEIRYLNREFVLFDFSTNGTQLLVRGQPRMLHHGQAALRGRGSIFLGRTQYSRQFEISFHASGSHG